MVKIFEHIRNKDSFIVLCFALIVVGDILTKFFPLLPVVPSKVVKALVLGVTIFMVFRTNRTFFYYFSVALLFYLIGTLSISFERALSNFSQFSEYYFVVFFYLAFCDVSLKKLSKFLEAVFIMHALVIVIASVFEIHFLKTYTYSARFGYTSLFNSQNEFSYIMMAGVAYFSFFAIKNKTLTGYLKAAFFIIASLLVGTKGIWVFVAIFLSYLFFTNIKPKYSLSIAALSAVVLFLSKNYIFTFFEKHFQVLANLYKEEGIVSFLSSKRSVYFSERIALTQEEFSVVNYLFGGNSSANPYEMSFMDLLFFLGAAGMLFYFFLVIKFVLRKISFDRTAKAYLVTAVFVSFIAGYLFENASAQIYTLLTLMVMGCAVSCQTKETGK